MKHSGLKLEEIQEYGRNQGVEQMANHMEGYRKTIWKLTISKPSHINVIGGIVEYMSSQRKRGYSEG